MKYLLCLALVLIPLLTPAQTITKNVHIPSPTQGESQYFYVPFDVPAGAKQVSVSYKYDKRNGANVLDLGLFDSRSSRTDRSTIGFRGWSGGRRDTIFVSTNLATNGYLSGEIPAGTWGVILGLYKIVREGVDVEINIDFNEISPQAAAVPQQENDTQISFLTRMPTPPHVTAGYTWFRGDLHMHTFHSDGQWTISKIFEYAKGNNLDFLGFTDHNTTSHHSEIDRTAKEYPEILAMRAEEVTTYGGHFNVWGLPSGTLIDFRVTPGDVTRLNQVLATVHALDLPASINHPTALCGGCSWSYGDDWSGMDSVEIWNGEWDLTDEAALQKWDKVLQQGSRITAIGSSDTHALPKTDPGSPMTIGLPTTFAGAERLTQIDVFSAIRKHRVYAAEKPNYIVELSANKAGIGDEIKVNSGKKVTVVATLEGFPRNSRAMLISAGRTVGDYASVPGTYSMSGEITATKNTYVRLEVRDEKGKMLAFTNPIFLQVKQ
jgi:hypothetical protein